MYIYIHVSECLHHTLCGWSVYYQKVKGIKSTFEAVQGLQKGTTHPMKALEQQPIISLSHPFPLVPSAQDAAMLNVERMAELSAVEAPDFG